MNFPEVPHPENTFPQYLQHHTAEKDYPHSQISCPPPQAFLVLPCWLREMNIKTSTRIFIPLALLGNRRAGSEISQKPLCAAGMLDGIQEEGRSRQELILLFQSLE